MKCSCGNDKFYAKQIVYVEYDGADPDDDSVKESWDVVVGENGDFLENVDGDHDGCSVLESENPDGPFECTKCGKEYDYLNEDDSPWFQPVTPIMMTTELLDRLGIKYELVKEPEVTDLKFHDSYGNCSCLTFITETGSFMKRL